MTGTLPSHCDYTCERRPEIYLWEQSTGQTSGSILGIEPATGKVATANFTTELMTRSHQKVF
jgi:hypothetical protein